MMEAVRTSETSVYSNETTLRYIPEGSQLHSRSRENLKSHICGTTCFNSAFDPQSVFMGFVLFWGQTSIIFLNVINQLIFVMLAGCVFFAVRTKIKKNIYILFKRLLIHCWMHSTLFACLLVSLVIWNFFTSESLTSCQAYIYQKDERTFVVVNFSVFLVACNVLHYTPPSPLYLLFLFSESEVYIN
jgi:hypothetical protein